MVEKYALNLLFSNQKSFFASQKTKEIAFRKAHLLKLKSAILNNENKI